MVSGYHLLEEILKHSTSEHRLSEMHELSFELTYSASIDKDHIDRERERIASILGANFVLEAIHPDLNRYLILRLPGIHRELSLEGSYAVAAELVDRLEVQAVIPEASESYPVEGPEPESLTIESALVKANCQSPVDESLEKDWVAKFLGLETIWQSNRGAGITIVQPDTGVASHAELEGALDMDRAFDAFTETVGDATDPLADNMTNPGHGTATSSVIASLHSGSVLGVAPSASVVPVRCMDSVILWTKAKELARAIKYAGEIDADIVSLSLGGIRHNSVQEAIRQIVDQGVIVVAAAGNCVGLVVYPASDRNTIGVAGCGASDNAWIGTSHGRRVDLAAPSENIFAARRTTDSTDLTTVRRSQGTSYGAAITAGVGALWLARHGRDNVRSFAKSRSIFVNDLFRAALRQSARPSTSNDWKNDMGAGILDAAALLAIELKNIDLSISSFTAAKFDDEAHAHAVYEMVSELSEQGEVVEGFDWGRHGPEVTYLAREALGRSSRAYSALVESSSPPVPSAKLETAKHPPVVAHVDKLLKQSPHADTVGAASFGGVDNLFRELATVRQGGLEAGGVGTSPKSSIENSLSGWQHSGGLESLANKSSTIIERLNAWDGAGSEERRKAMQSGLEALDVLQQGGPMNSLGLEARIGLESLVRMEGRPAYRLREGKVSPDDPMYSEGAWGPMFSNWTLLPTVAGAVGRINLGQTHVGTGFLFKAKSNYIMTNRHVLESIAVELKTAQESHWVFSDQGASIDFSDMGLAGSAFEITKVIFADPSPINGRVNLNRLDLVVLEIEGHSGNLPKPLVLSPMPNMLQEEQRLFVIGYPAEPSPSDFVDPERQHSEEQVAAALGRIFGISYGSKHLSPGAIIKGTGELTNDSRNWAFAHDATTLGGSSGSMIMLIGSDEKVAGIHFAGKVLSQNLSHQISQTDVMSFAR